jgi:hypothetical protein
MKALFYSAPEDRSLPTEARVINDKPRPALGLTGANASMRRPPTSIRPAPLTFGSEVVSSWTSATCRHRMTAAARSAPPSRPTSFRDPYDRAIRIANCVGSKASVGEGRNACHQHSTQDQWRRGQFGARLSIQPRFIAQMVLKSSVGPVYRTVCRLSRAPQQPRSICSGSNAESCNIRLMDTAPLPVCRSWQ